MSSSFFLKATLITIAVIGLSVALIIIMPGSAKQNAPLVGVILFSLLVVGVIVYLVIMPSLYRKKLEQKKGKSLRSFVMTDPRFREAMSSRTESRQGEQESIGKEETKPQPENTETASVPEKSEEETRQQEKKSTEDPPGEDDLFA